MESDRQAAPRPAPQDLAPLLELPSAEAAARVRRRWGDAVDPGWLGRLHERASAGRRRGHGVFYTPPALARYLVARAFDGLAPRAAGEPLRVVDPACGGGAFLLAAWERRREVGAVDLYGVDLDPGAAALSRLALRLAAGGEPPQELDRRIRAGHSLVADPRVDPGALDWRAAFPEVFAAGGFDAVLGNPPFVRRQHLGPLGPYLARRYACHHGFADLYVYFCELGLELLRPGGRLALVVANKWLKAAYGEPLRRYLGARAEVEEVIDLAHAQGLFGGADAFPCLLVARRHSPGTASGRRPRGAVVEGTDATSEGFAERVAVASFELEPAALGSGPWILEPPALARLMARVEAAGEPLGKLTGPPLAGLKTGLNRAYVVDRETRARLLGEDPGCGRHLRPLLRGRDLGRWAARPSREWVVMLRSSANHPWPWARAASEAAAEEVFARHLGALHRHLKAHEEALRRRADQGRFWWELRSSAAYGAFDAPKLLWQDLSFHPCFCRAGADVVPDMTCFALPADDAWILACLGSAVAWAWLWRRALHGKDEALRLKTLYTRRIPIARASEPVRRRAASLVGRLEELARRGEGWRGSQAALALERELAAMVAAAYGLDARDLALLERTAPPRSPPLPPPGSAP